MQLQIIVHITTRSSPMIYLDSRYIPRSLQSSQGGARYEYLTHETDEETHIVSLNRQLCRGF